MTIPVVYKILNIYSKKIYIGSTYNFEKRKREHINLLKKNKHSNRYMQNSWNKYGESAFIFEILEELSHTNFLEEREQYYLDTLRPFDPSIGYNICQVAYNSIGVKRTEETKEKMSKSKRGSKNPMYGKNLSNETKLKLSLSKKGEKHWSYGIKGKDNHNSKEIYQYSLNGQFIKKWNSISDIGRELEEEIPKISKNLSHISACCKGKCKTVKGFIWKYTLENLNG